MVIFYMIKMMVNVQFSLSLVMLKIMGFELECDQGGWNQEHMNLGLFMLL